MNKKIITSIISVLITLIGIFAYIKIKPTENLKGDSSLKYAVMKIASTTSKAYLSVDGKVEANDTKKVYVDKKLKVKEIFVKEGDYIEKDTILMTFDENSRNTLIRNIEKEKLNLSKLQRNLNVERQLQRIGGSSRNSVLELEESVRASQIAIEEYNEDLEKTVEFIKSPVSGTITSLTAEENYSVNTEQPLMEITDLTEVKIVLEIPEYDIINVKLGQKIDILPEVYEKKKTFHGKVIDISKISKTSSSSSENIVEIEVKPDTSIGNLLPGFKVSATVYLDAGDEGINIPKTALLEDETSKSFYVFVVNPDSNNTSGTIERRDVSIKNIPQGDEISIESGIKIGDIILKTPSITQKNGDKINITYENGKKQTTRQSRSNSSGNGGHGGGPPM
ncbi:efflux RND transporter periplasmic adaptor subunit [Fusobacterium sp. PH5-44]|uniref:efflux RND transporter periplasmic adaptor subunit n=1 Tax=unclassified Fusobacterium TaxID=2648384 RepID=UPI003D252C1E